MSLTNKFYFEIIYTQIIIISKLIQYSKIK